MKCEWKDGKLSLCREMKSHFRAVVNNVVRFMVANGDIGIYFCPFCGADIRKPEPKAPTHEEIWNKSWCIGENSWSRVTGYRDGKYIMFADFESSVFRLYSKEEFIGRKSADIPSEAIK